MQTIGLVTGCSSAMGAENEQLGSSVVGATKRQLGPGAENTEPRTTPESKSEEVYGALI
jgi:hypothetical protein